MQKLSDHPSLQERAYRVLRTAILEAEFEPGERLFELELAERLGISRSPVREAVRRLQQDGLIEAKSRSGIYVATVSSDEVDDVFRIRGALEGAAAALAAERITSRELERLSRRLDTMQRAVDQADESAAIRASDRFHRAIHAAARSQRLFTMLEQIYGQVTHFRNITLHIPGRTALAARGHRELLEALQDRNPELAERVMKDHIDGARRALLRRIEEDAIS